MSPSIQQCPCGTTTYLNSSETNYKTSSVNNIIINASNKYYSTSDYGNYSGAANAKENIVLSAEAKPNLTANTYVYSNYSESSRYPSVSYTNETKQVKISEDLGKRIGQETDDIVARVLKESNLPFNNTNNITNFNSYGSQQAQNAYGITLDSAGESPAPNKNYYGSTTYVATEKNQCFLNDC